MKMVTTKYTEFVPGLALVGQRERMNGKSRDKAKVVRGERFEARLGVIALS